MSVFVYRRTFSIAFVYRIFNIMIHKVLCGLQNIHKLFCGSYFAFQYTLKQFFSILRYLKVKIICVDPCPSVIKKGDAQWQ